VIELEDSHSGFCGKLVGVVKCMKNQVVGVVG
jgi:hypothetical protein